MAKLFPDVAKTRVVFASSAEERFYSLCMQQLDHQWHVYYSCTLSSIDGPGMADNEADFVLYHPKLGVIVVEIKGGRIRYEAESDQYFSMDRHGRSFAIKNPFQQALIWKSRFIRYSKQYQLRVPITHSVCFPSVHESEIPRSANVETEIVIGINRLQDLAATLESMVRKVQPERFLEFRDCGDELTKILKSESYATKLHFRDYIDGHERRLKDIEFLHDAFVRPIVGSKKLGIEGEAGTGKTLLASLVARHFRDNGKKVLFLSTNHLLNNVLRRDFGDDIEINTYTDLAKSFGVDLLRPEEGYPGSKTDWIQIEAPARLEIALKNYEQRFDVIVCDEAQDVQPFWWEFFESLLQQDDDSRFYIFFDRGQGVFGSGDNENFIPEEVLPVAAPYFPLIHNYRTTSEIAGFARQFRSGHKFIHSHSERLGYLPQIITYKDEKDAQAKLSDLVRNLTTIEGLRPEECAIISARKPDSEPSIIENKDKISGVKLNFLYKLKNKKTPHIPGEIPIATVSMFKGLEASVGILINFSEYNLPADHPIMASQIYVACTRAKHMLYVFVKEGEGKDKFFAEALQSVAAVGAVTVHDEKTDYHYIGRVTQYNSERFGMMAVEDPTFQRGKIMFFPKDVPSEISKKIKTGLTLRFRPEHDGDVVIATDLQLVHQGEQE